MQKIYNYLKSYWIEEVKLSYFLTIVAFLALSIFLEYNMHFFSRYIKPNKGNINLYFGNILFYSISLLFAVLAYILFYNRKELFKNVRFWVLLFFIICTFSLHSYSFQFGNWVIELFGGNADKSLLKTVSQIIKSLLFFVTAFIFWKLSRHSKKIPYYGFKLKGVDIKPFFIILLLFLPLIIIASTQSDFLHYYPTFRSFIFMHEISLSDISKIGVYEIFYGSNFVAIELFFRGFMIYTLSKFLGRGAIIPMAIMYVFCHFGKPIGETISSFFGGMILGVISYETNSIIGGIIIHCGIAYMMEVGALIGNLI